jgi:hypothetical protein
MDLVSFKLPTHLIQCYRTEGWVGPKGGWNDRKQEKFLALMGVKFPTSHLDKADVQYRLVCTIRKCWHINVLPSLFKRF